MAEGPVEGGEASVAEAERELLRGEVLQRFHILDTDPEQAFDDIAVLAAQICGTPIAAVSLVDSHRLWFKAKVGLEVCETPREVSFCSRAIEDPHTPLIVCDARIDPRFAHSPLVTGDPHLVFYAGIPLVSSGRVPLGSLCVLDRVPRTLSDEQLDSLRSLARQVESQLELRRELGNLALAHAERALAAPIAATSAEHFAVAFQNSPISMNLVGLDGRFLQVNAAFCQLVGRPVEQLLGSSVKTVVIEGAFEDEKTLIDRLLAGEVRSILRDGRVATASGGSVSVMATTSVVRDDEGEPLFFLSQVEDISARRQAEGAVAIAETAVEALIATDAHGNVTFWNGGAERMFGHRSGEVIGSPVAVIIPERFKRAHHEGMARLLAGGDPGIVGSTQEVVACRSDGTELPVALSLSRWESHGQTSYTAIVRDVSERKALLAQLDRRANVDELTGLATVARFGDWLAALADDRSDGSGPAHCAVVRISLDQFQLVNSSFGRAVGDDVLREVARRLQCLHAPDERVARIGADDFAVLCGPVVDQVEARGLARAVVDCLAAPVAVADHSIELTASIGIALVDPVDPVRALREADDAVHRAKALGRGRIQVFDEALRHRSIERLDVEAGLRRALSLGELVVHYQPQIDLGTGAIVGAEALVRWMHPTDGLLPPSRFIDVAEDSGLVVPLGAWVLSTALDQLARWQRESVVAADFVLAVNLSARQLTDATMATFVADRLASTGCLPAQLCLEVTETALTEDTAVAAATMDALASLGVRLALDDFGTGYSSLAHLERFPVNQLKIDRTFVKRLDHGVDAISEAIVLMARSLGMETVAEGIETPAQLAATRALGCDQGQGYLFSRPVSAADFAALASSRPSW